MVSARFRTTLHSKHPRAWFGLDRRRGAGDHPAPECVVLDVRPDVTPSAKQPVRLFLGTEAAQHRAERVYIWSIEQVRDPSRVYEIYLMNDLAGFERPGWKTGFTCYRFAIPHLAGATGRAIYNDVDQIYLADPGELFDTDMDGHGVLALDHKETSVMLIDCARMAPVWTLDLVRRGHKKPLRAKALAVPELWGKFAPEWNARDGEYVPGQSKLLHYTTLHAQPWRPFPQFLRYKDNPNAEVWLAMEQAADAEGFQVSDYQEATP